MQLNTGVITKSHVEIKIGDKLVTDNGCDAVVKLDEKSSEPVAFVKGLGIAYDLKKFVDSFSDIRIKGNLILC